MFEGLDDHAERAMAYYGNDLSPEEKAEFEKHLATCAECQALLAKAKQLLPVIEPTLAFTPKHTVEEQVARIMALPRGPAAKERSNWMPWAVGFAFAAAAAAAWAIVFARPSSGPPPTLPTPGFIGSPSPSHSTPDGG